ncbi:hypothetical protein [Inquilinus sp. OTU3971]|uniref:hypothetical protein n=1 Tax=Inquilinus sp. OTU3971 TaxID=3043855 RepID=UPI00313C0208
MRSAILDFLRSQKVDIGMDRDGEWIEFAKSNRVYVDGMADAIVRCEERDGWVASALQEVDLREQELRKSQERWGWNAFYIGLAALAMVFVAGIFVGLAFSH